MSWNQTDQEKEGAGEGGRQDKDTHKLHQDTALRLGGGEQMERFVRVPYGLYQGTQYGNTLPWGQPRLSEHKQRDWRQNTGTPTFLARPGLLVPTPASGYCTDPYKGSQLKAILARMNPSLSLRLCKANTKEVGVQVSPRVDRSVQCSLGPRTLHSRFLWDNAGHRAALPAWGVYSAVTGRRGSFWPRKDWGDEGTKVLSGPVEASQQQQQQPPPSPPTPEAQEKLGEEDAQSPGERKSQQAPGDAADPLKKPSFQVHFLSLSLSSSSPSLALLLSIPGVNESKAFPPFLR